MYLNKTRIINAAINSTGRNGYNIYVLAFNNAGALGSPSTKQVSVFFTGGGLTQQKINTITDIIEENMDAKKTGVIP